MGSRDHEIKIPGLVSTFSFVCLWKSESVVEMSVNVSNPWPVWDQIGLFFSAFSDSVYCSRKKLRRLQVAPHHMGIC